MLIFFSSLKFATLKNIGLKNVTHRDLRPENLAWGLGEHSDILYALGELSFYFKFNGE